MTRHRSREERVEEILSAAVDEINENGLPGLTMGALACRTTISKAAIYRFFSNKRDVTLAVFDFLLERYCTFDVDEALGWGLSLTDTFTRCLHGRHTDEDWRRFDRAWIQLLPVALHDEEFAERRRAGLEQVQQLYARLARGLVARERLTPSDGFEERLRTGVLVGTCFMEGLGIEAMVTGLGAQHEETIRQFFETLVAEVLGTRRDVAARADGEQGHVS